MNRVARNARRGRVIAHVLAEIDGGLQDFQPISGLSEADWDRNPVLKEGETKTSVVEWADLFGGIPAPNSSAFFGLCRFCQANAVIVNAALPWLAAEIGHHDGYKTMLEFIRLWGGMRLYVSKDHARFKQKVGCDVSETSHRRLVRDAGAASQVEVPSAWGVFMALRRAAIAIAIRSSLPHDEISRRFGVTMRSLR